MFKEGITLQLHSTWWTRSYNVDVQSLPEAFHLSYFHGTSCISHYLQLQIVITHIRKVIFNVNDTTRIAATTARFLDEVFGDRPQYISVLHQHDTKLKTNVRAAADKAMKEASLSTERVIQAFTLSNSDAAFVKVRDEIDKAMAT